MFQLTGINVQERQRIEQIKFITLIVINLSVNFPLISFPPVWKVFLLFLFFLRDFLKNSVIAISTSHRNIFHARWIIINV